VYNYNQYWITGIADYSVDSILISIRYVVLIVVIYLVHIL